MRDFLDRLLEEYLREARATSGLTFADTSRNDPYKSFKFIVTISGNMVFAKAGFQKVSGLKMTTDVTEYREGGDNNTVSKTPGLTKFDPITLERGMSEDGDMWNWASKMFSLDGDTNVDLDPKFRANVEISLKDRNGSIVRTWLAPNCWVSEYDTGEFDAMSNNVMIEKLTLQHEGFKKTKG